MKSLMARYHANLMPEPHTRNTYDRWLLGLLEAISIQCLQPQHELTKVRHLGNYEMV